LLGAINLKDTLVPSVNCGGAVIATPDGRIWAADASGCFFIFGSDGTFIETGGDAGEGPGQFKFVNDDHTGNIKRSHQVDAARLFMPDGAVYVADTLNKRIQKFMLEGL